MMRGEGVPKIDSGIRCKDCGQSATIWKYEQEWLCLNCAFERAAQDDAFDKIFTATIYHPDSSRLTRESGRNK